MARSLTVRCKNRSLARRGAATVEFAIIVPFLIALTLGMIEVTHVAQTKNCLTDAARSSCRLAIQPGSSNQAVTDNINTILSANGIASANATITILVNGASANVSTAAKYDQISVKIQLP